MILMKLEFEGGFIPDQIFKELDFQGFLTCFEKNIPAIPHRILRVLNEAEAGEWFSRLADLDSRITRHGIDIADLLQKAGELPALDAMLPFYRNRQLEPFHLFDLGTFLKKDSRLKTLEKNIPVPEKESVCRQIHQDLELYTSDDCSNIILTPEEMALRSLLNSMEEKIAGELSLFEHEIHRQTGLKLIYPYPKEIEKDHKELERIKSCQFLKLKDEGVFFRIDYRLSETIKNLVRERQTSQNRWDQLMEQKLLEMNNILAPSLTAFTDYYEKRKQRLFDYVILAVKRDQGLCFPEFRSESIVKLKRGILPVLKNLHSDRYNPLDLELNSGVNLLFGANMTGKTTVLKTLYFHLVLAKFGLPVPAESFILSHLNRVELQLKSSGDTGRGLSGFADEIRFFCSPADPPSIFLIDEMFHSTDPINGVALSEAFLGGLRDSDNTYICTSHYPEVLNIPDIRFLRMKDFEGEIDTGDLKSLLEKVPYELEEISAGRLEKTVKDNKKPLQIALQFPLPETIKANIKKKLKD